MKRKFQQGQQTAKRLLLLLCLNHTIDEEEFYIKRWLLVQAGKYDCIKITSTEQTVHLKREKKKFLNSLMVITHFIDVTCSVTMIIINKHNHIKQDESVLQRVGSVMTPYLLVHRIKLLYIHAATNFTKLTYKVAFKVIFVVTM